MRQSIEQGVWYGFYIEEENLQIFFMIQCMIFLVTT